MLLFAVIATALVSILLTSVFFTLKINALETAHKQDIQDTFQRAHDTGYAKGNVVGQATAYDQIEFRH